MLGIVNSVLAGLVNFSFDIVLLKLRTKALCLKDCCNKGLSFDCGAKENFMHSSAIVDCFELYGVVLYSAFSFSLASECYLPTIRCVGLLFTICFGLCQCFVFF